MPSPSAESISHRPPVTRTVVWLFVAGSVLSFLGMAAMPFIYDEGITLTSAMNVLAGQVPHRDFYALYGPLHSYSIAFLFRIFGQSMTAERALYAVISGAIIAVFYSIASKWASHRLSLAATAMMMLWLFGLNSVSASAIYPASLANFGAVALLLPAFAGRLSRRRAFAAGICAGLSMLVRYDVGVAMLLVQACIVGFAAFTLAGTLATAARTFARSFWPVAAGFAICVVPVALAYLAVAPFHAFLHDIVIYPGKYYNRVRAVPFPVPHLKFFDVTAIYAIVVVFLAALLYGAGGLLRARRRAPSDDDRRPWLGFLFAFGLLALVMYMKGVVRASVAQMYLSLAPAVLLLPVFVEHRRALRRPLALLMEAMAVVMVLAALCSAMHEAWYFHKERLWMPETVWAAHRGTLPPLQETWCHTPSPLTRGICFIPDDDHIRAIEYLRARATPGQTLYVGLLHHDRIFINDNLTNFAVGQLPATHWSHFDPLLENRADIQQQMIADLERNRPPYAVLDAEFEGLGEPSNASSISTGVFLLDDYLHAHYHEVADFGKMHILARNAGS